MDKIQKLKQEKQYEQYVKEKTPRHNLFLNMCKAFFLGGLICLLGQVIYHYFELRNLSPDECSRWMSLSLILLSVLFTGTGIYQKLAAWGGAGALVPITGFANSVAAPAIEYKKEGQVFGIGCKIFTNCPFIRLSRFHTPFPIPAKCGRRINSCIASKSQIILHRNDAQIRRASHCHRNKISRKRIFIKTGLIHVFLYMYAGDSLNLPLNRMQTEALSSPEIHFLLKAVSHSELKSRDLRQ